MINTQPVQKKLEVAPKIHLLGNQTERCLVNVSAIKILVNGQIGPSENNSYWKS